MNVVCIIPARIGSTRLSRKPLQLLGKHPIVYHTYTKAMQCQDIDHVAVTTDNEEIAAVIKALNGDVIMTSAEINTGSDRVAAAAQAFPEADVIINLQGDEPFVKPDMLSRLVAPFAEDAQVQMTTLGGPLLDRNDYLSPDKVKVIIDNQSNALYFSRAPIPYYRTEQNFDRVYHHMGLYAFRKRFLTTYTQLPQTPLELAESLEQLRALEHGYKIRVATVNENTLEINTEAELQLAQQLIEQL